MSIEFGFVQFLEWAKEKQYLSFTPDFPVVKFVSFGGSSEFSLARNSLTHRCYAEKDFFLQWSSEHICRYPEIFALLVKYLETQGIKSLLSQVDLSVVLEAHSEALALVIE